MEQVANAIGRAFKDDFGPLGIRNRLQHTGRVGIGMGPEGHLRAVEELNGAGPPNPLRSRCADLVAAVQLVEEQLLRIRRARRSEEHTSELQSLMRHPSAVFCLKNKK